MDRAVTAPGAEDSFEIRIVEHLLKIGEAFGIGAAVDKILFSDGVAGERSKAPAFDLLDRGLDLFAGDIAGGTGDTDGIAGFEIGWDQQGWCGFACAGSTEDAHAQYGGEKVFSIHLNIKI